MKELVFLLLTSFSVVGQVPDKAKEIIFDLADREHCSIVMIQGRPMLQTVYGVSIVAVGLPVATVDGDFRVFIFVRQMGLGQTEVKPSQFSALYSDKVHTRFSFYDKAGEVRMRQMLQHSAQESPFSASFQGGPVVQGMPPTLGAGAPMNRRGSARRRRGAELNGPLSRRNETSDEIQEESKAGISLSPEALYLSASTLHQGEYAEGYVYFRKPKRSKISVSSQDQLFEIDVPVNGVVFRFSRDSGSATK